MKIIKSGNIYRIADTDTVIEDQLDESTYQLDFSKQVGPFLTKTDTLEIGEHKIYGESPAKGDMIIKAFNHTDRSLGVMYGGGKGIGKTLAVRYLSTKLREQGIPTIIVNGPIPGMIDFIQGLKQEALVLFDEFEKKFPRKSGDSFSQEDLLSLFDGISATKHLYVVTYNYISGISEFLVDRPGRFHYNIQLHNPDKDDIKQYIKDNVTTLSPEKLAEQSEKVVKLSQLMDLNYDNLRAIAFEVNMGNDISEVIDDLNIGQAIRATSSTYDYHIIGEHNKFVFNGQEDIDMKESVNYIEDYNFKLKIDITQAKVTENGSISFDKSAIGIIRAADPRDPNSSYDKEEDCLPEGPDTVISKVVFTPIFEDVRSYREIL